MSQPLLTDSMDSRSPRDERYEDLLRKYERLKDELADEKLKTQEARNQSSRALRSQVRLKQHLEPLYRALRGIMEDLPSDEVEVSGMPPSVQSDKWLVQKNLFPGKPAEIIDLLLLRPNMNTTELATANRSDPRTITKAIYILSKAGLIEKNGGRFSLKQL